MERPHFPRWRPVLGSSAGEEVFVTPGLSPRLRLAVLAHEATHVLQRRRARAGIGAAGSANALEAEAHNAARAALTGGRAPCQLADRDGLPRAWGEAGHYYTVLLVLLAAGMDKALAAKQAFYAQMPDQVDEFDAIHAGENLACWKGVPGAPASKHIDEDYIAQEGLHCLTGGNAQSETEYRIRVLKAAPVDSFAFGLGMHPFGDSYAHRVLNNQSVLYSRGTGHLRDGTTPDTVETRPKLFVDYGTTLFNIVVKKLNGAPLRMEREKLTDYLQFCTTYEIERLLIPEIRWEILHRFNFNAERYMPEIKSEKCAPWKTFRARFGLPLQMEADTMQLAWMWSHRQEPTSR